MIVLLRNRWVIQTYQPQENSIISAIKVMRPNSVKSRQPLIFKERPQKTTFSSWQESRKCSKINVCSYFTRNHYGVRFSHPLLAKSREALNLQGLAAFYMQRALRNGSFCIRRIIDTPWVQRGNVINGDKNWNVVGTLLLSWCWGQKVHPFELTVTIMKDIW